MDGLLVTTDTVIKKKKRHIGGWMGGFIFCLIFLLAGSLPALLEFPRVQARFNGVETQALVSVESGNDCGDDEDGGSYFTYTFADTRGRVQEITDNSVCSSGIVSAGDKVTIWYEPNNPVVFISDNDLKFDGIFVVCFSLPVLFYLVSLIFFICKRIWPKKPREYWPGLD